MDPAFFGAGKISRPDKDPLQRSDVTDMVTEPTSRGSQAFVLIGSSLGGRDK
jgi:hypothetical protein